MIDRSTLDNIKVKAGQMIKIDVRVSGEPAPSKKWFINKEKQESEKNDLKIDEEPNRTKLVIPCCKRAHNGEYIIKAENSAGRDEAKIEVIVLGTLP